MVKFILLVADMILDSLILLLLDTDLMYGIGCHSIYPFIRIDNFWELQEVLGYSALSLLK